MAAGAGKKESTLLCLFLEVYGLEAEEELSTVATQAWAEGVCIGKWHTEKKSGENRYLRFRCGDK